jgi:hypothetical protein
MLQGQGLEAQVCLFMLCIPFSLDTYVGMILLLHSAGIALAEAWRTARRCAACGGQELGLRVVVLVVVPGRSRVMGSVPVYVYILSVGV